MPTVEASADLMSPLHLFLQADAVVKAVMIGLLLASVWTWAIIFTHSIRLKRINRGTDRFERDFWATNDIDAFHSSRSNDRLPIAAVMSAAMEGKAVANTRSSAANPAIFAPDDMNAVTAEGAPW